MKILELPFHQRPPLELLALEIDRATPDRQYAGYGWTKVGRLWLDDVASKDEPENILASHVVDDALVLALHSADDGEPIADDIELEFELPGADPVSVLASDFLAKWLPQLPRASAIVLALCNWHHAKLVRPQAASVPLYYATGHVDSWLEITDEDRRVRLAADGSWARLPA